MNANWDEEQTDAKIALLALSVITPDTYFLNRAGISNK